MMSEDRPLESRATNFRAMAARARMLATSANNPQVAQNFLKLAAQLEQEARRTEELADAAKNK